jgi:predicted aspartyl protease
VFRYGPIQHKRVPAPQISVRVSSPQQEHLRSEVEALVDTGAAMTCIPEKIIAQLDKDCLQYNVRTVTGATGQQENRCSYIVHLHIAECDFRDIEVIALDRDYALIGRDILNEYELTFDGPNKIWEVGKYS